MTGLCAAKIKMHLGDPLEDSLTHAGQHAPSPDGNPKINESARRNARATKSQGERGLAAWPEPGRR